jgi:hypothetical protein
MESKTNSLGTAWNAHDDVVVDFRLIFAILKAFWRGNKARYLWNTEEKNMKATELFFSDSRLIEIFF